MENIETVESQGKIEQLSSLKGFSISDDQLEQFLIVNFKHLNLIRGKNQDEDVSLISWYTNKKFLAAIALFDQIKLISIGDPVVIPYIKNVINENSPKISLEPKGFKGKLYPPQAALIKRMLDIESQGLYCCLEDSEYKITGGVVKERLSFGKTYCLPALICERFIPYESQKENLINVNLVICGTKVAKEWKNNLKNFTCFNFAIIERQTDLDKLEKSVNNEYPEIIVVKDGDITWKNKKCKAIEHLIEILGTKVLSRIICDDYDMLKFKSEFAIPEALFTWFVSGTDGGKHMSDVSFYWFKNNIKIQIKLSSLIIIADGISAIQCNKEYSAVEYNIPKIDMYEPVERCSLEELVRKIVNNEDIDRTKILPHPELKSILFIGDNDCPYTYDKQKLKILVAIEDKPKQSELINLLNNSGIKTIKLTRANVDKFHRENTTVCVSGNLFGVNMGFLTHIVIDEFSFANIEMAQIIGRGQRISRKQNLQVYFHKVDENDDFTDDDFTEDDLI